MYKIGECIIYGNNGVCKVDSICTMGSGKDVQDYYCLIPASDSSGKIFTPINNDKVIMRRVLSKEEAMALIESIPDIEQLNIEDEKQRESGYKQAIHSCDCRELVRVIKTMYFRKKERLAKGMKSTVIDDRYLKEAENNLYSELALAMGKDKSEIPEYVIGRIEKE